MNEKELTQKFNAMSFIDLKKEARAQNISSFKKVELICFE
jgi:hypothetical protein